MSKKIRDLRHKAGVNLQKMRGMNDKAESENRDFNASEQKEYDALEKEAESLIARAGRLENAEGLGRGETAASRLSLGSGDAPAIVRSPGDPMSFLNGDGVMMGDALRALTGDSRVNGQVRELSDELAKKQPANVKLQGGGAGILMPMAAFFGTRQPQDQIRNVITTSSGGTGLMFVEHADRDLVERLRENLDVGRLGAEIVADIDGHKLTIPRVKTSPTLHWVAEGGALTNSDGSIDAITMDFHTAGVLTTISRETMMTSAPRADAAIRRDVGGVLRQGIDRAAVSGPGTGNQPKGILGHFPADTTDVQDGEIHPVVGGTNGGVPDWEKINQFRELVESSNGIVNPQNAGWLITAKLARKLRTTVRVSGTDSQMIMDPDQLATEGREVLCGYPCHSSRASTSLDDALTKGSSSAGSSAVFGDFSSLALGFWGVIEIMLNPYGDDDFKKGNISLRAFMHMDVALKQPKSFAGTKDLLAAA